MHNNTYPRGTNALEMRAKHACNSYKCITRLIVTGTRHHYAGWAWSCTNFVHSAQNAPLANRGTESEVAAQILPSWGPKEKNKKRSICLSINTWGDWFYQPL